MSDGVTLELDDRELQAALLKLAKQLGKKTLFAALRSGARPILADAKDNAPVGETGDLKRSIGIRQRAYKDSVNVFVGTKGIRYAHLVEFGVKRHQQGKGEHPGFDPKPFLRPAFDKNVNEATNRARAVLVRAISKVKKGA